MYGEPGGTILDDTSFHRQVLRAEMCEVVRQVCFKHDAQIVDALLDHFYVSRKAFK